MFYVLEGELDLLAFHPGAQASGDWRTWESQTGDRVMRGGPGSFMLVPAGCPHAFFNPRPEPAGMLFLVSPAGHEIYLQELSSLLAGGGPPDPAEMRPCVAAAPCTAHAVRLRPGRGPSGVPGPGVISRRDAVPW